MARKNKFYIPLVTIKGQYGKSRQVTLINAEKIPEIKKLIPAIEDIKMNLANQKLRIERGKEYSPLRVKVSKEKFQELEEQIRKKKPNHIFTVKVLDIVSDIEKPPIVQIISI